MVTTCEKGLPQPVQITHITTAAGGKTGNAEFEKSHEPGGLILLHLFLYFTQHIDGETAVNFVALGVEPVV